jgi:hypothetical protein
MEILEPKEADIRFHTQEVRGSSPCAPTNKSRPSSSWGWKLFAPSGLSGIGKDGA